MTDIAALRAAAQAALQGGKDANVNLALLASPDRILGLCDENEQLRHELTLLIRAVEHGTVVQQIAQARAALGGKPTE